MVNSLVDIHNAKTGKFSDKWESYLAHYDKLFTPFRDHEICLAEIGVQNGGSLETWAEYFPKAKRIVGVEIDHRCAGLTYEDPRIELHIQDGKNTVAGEYDIVIEDGSHTPQDMVETFKAWFPIVKTGGIYICEDLHTMWMPKQYETGAQDFFAGLITDVNREFSGKGYDIASMEFRNSLVIIHKGPALLGNRLMRGNIRIL